jgi:excinuclease ABC subunit C
MAVGRSPRCILQVMPIAPPGEEEISHDIARNACLVLPRQPGVYRFRDAAGHVMYIGRASDLRGRARSYWGGLAGRRHLRRMVSQIARVEAVACASIHEACWLERNLLERSKPRWNRATGGQEVPRWLVVDRDPDRPRIQLTHEPGTGRPAFGPYLGGDRSRAALRGILRVWPLHLTGARCSGTEKAIAEARGLGADDREQMLTDISQLLGRDPHALDRVTSRLLTARDEAVAGLMFETAQQIHDELGAVAWLASPQRVTASHPPGLIVCGWAAGILVSFSGTTTRLDRWDLRRVSECRGRALAQQTPPEWREFAITNAELAAALAHIQRG